MNTIEEMIKDLYQEQEEKQDPKNVNRLTEEERQEIQYARDQIYREKREDEERRKILLEQVIEATTPKKGTTTNENYSLPVSTYQPYMKSKEYDYRLIGALTLNSLYGGSFLNQGVERYMYANNINWEEIAEMVGKKPQAVQRTFKKMLKSELDLFGVDNTKNGVVYKLRYATDNKYYVTINHYMLEELVLSTNSNVLKLYSLMCYHLSEGRKQMTYDYMCEEIGLSSKTNRRIVSTMLNTLAKLGYIKIYEIDTPIRKWDAKQKKEIVLTVKGFEYELTTFEEWAQLNESTIKKINKRVQQREESIKGAI